MKVAIIGAGLAGLSCAYEFERHGVKPTIFEISSYIGEQYPHVAGSLEIVSRPIRDPVKYMKKKFDLEIKPLNTINSVIHHSPNITTEVKGKLGYLFLRDKSSEDIKNQIYSKLKKTNIMFNTYGDYETLSKKFDYVVVANGKSNFTNELGCWFEYLNTYVRGAVVLGDFDPNTLVVWINKVYCKNGYAYLTPFNKHKASLVLIVTDATEREMDYYWELFLNTENIKHAIIEEFSLNHRSGNVFPHRTKNIFLVGNAGGTIDPFLGFGTISSIITGAMAARSIVKNKDYEKLIKSLINKNKQLYEFRKIYEKLNNKDYDKMIAALKLPGVQYLLYHTPFNAVKYGAFAFKAINNKTKV